MLYWDAYSRHPQISAASRNGLLVHSETKPLHGLSSRTARAESCYLASVTPAADTNAQQRTATGQREGEGARLRGDV